LNFWPWWATIGEVRVISWNINFPRPERAKRQGDLLRELAPDLMLLQEVNPRSSEVLRDSAGADWMVRAIDLPDPEHSPVRRRGVAIAGRGLPPRRRWLLPRRWWLPKQIRQPERILLVETQPEGTPLIAVSYHAPPGVSWRMVKPWQAVAFASWLSKQNEPLLFGADSNTPDVDALDFSDTRTHWHTGRGSLRGERGDDLLFGPDKKHDLEDALRCWLKFHPGEMDRLRSRNPSGPLAITHRTGRRKNSPGTGRRYDSVWISHHWIVRNVEHLYEAGIEAGSDHAPVVVDLDPSSLSRTSSTS
jgi:endonuclease/exonuclease/phosphatase family metal-dependent hydrolase